jgi:hypothetical protein
MKLSGLIEVSVTLGGYDEEVVETERLATERLKLERLKTRG